MTPDLLHQSTETKILGVWTSLVTFLIGGVMMAFGGWFLWQEMQHPPAHSTHVYLFAGIFGLGALVIRPDPIVGAVTKVFVILGDTNLPLVGGRRKTDPPADAQVVVVPREPTP